MNTARGVSLATKLVVVDHRSLLAIDRVGFGKVNQGKVCRRAFVVRTADNSPLGEIVIENAGCQYVSVATQGSPTKSHAIVAATFNGASTGVYRGVLTLIPSNGQHDLIRIPYDCDVIQ